MTLRTPACVSANDRPHRLAMAPNRCDTDYPIPAGVEH